MKTTSPMRAPRVALILTALWLSGSAGFGHDLWIEPSSFVLPPGAPLTLGLRIGDRLGDPFPRATSLIVRFEALSPSGSRKPVLGIEGGDPAGFLRPKEPGTWTIAYESTAHFSDLEAAKFESYLVEEGLERISELRRSRGQVGQSGTELFSRSVKSLVQVGDAGAKVVSTDRAVGLPLELVLTSKLASGDLDSEARGPAQLVLQLLFRGQPVGGSKIDLRKFGATEVLAEKRTDVSGNTRFAPGPGRWIAAAVHMLPSEGEDQEQRADWRSWFSTLTFEIKASD